MTFCKCGCHDDCILTSLCHFICCFIYILTFLFSVFMAISYYTILSFFFSDFTTKGWRLKIKGESSFFTRPNILFRYCESFYYGEAINFAHIYSLSLLDKEIIVVTGKPIESRDRLSGVSSSATLSRLSSCLPYHSHRKKHPTFGNAPGESAEAKKTPTLGRVARDMRVWMVMRRQRTSYRLTGCFFAF